MMKLFCFIGLHRWREIWMGERKCHCCGQHQFRHSLYDGWENVTAANKPVWELVEKTKRGGQ